VRADEGCAVGRGGRELMMGNGVAYSGSVRWCGGNVMRGNEEAHSAVGADEGRGGRAYSGSVQWELRRGLQWECAVGANEGSTVGVCSGS
jgi:hypothetical protein